MFKDDIKVIDRPVKSELALTQELQKDLARPLLFTNVDGKGSRVLGNLWTTRKRLAKALRTDVAKMPRDLLAAMKAPAKCKTVRTSLLKGSTSKVDILKLPIPKFFEKDGGRYFTSAMVVAKDKKGKMNLSYHRMMVLGKDRVVARLVERHLYSMYLEAKQNLKVSIFLTMEPEVMLAGAMSVDYGTNELEIASALKRKGSREPLKVVKLGNGIPVPASSEYAFEAVITKEEAKEGPFVDITGTYDKIRDQPVIKLKRMYTASDPMFPTITPAGLDHFLMMGMPREPIILEAVERAVPKVGSVRLTEGGCSWLHGVVSIKQQRQGDAKNAIKAALGAHTSMKRVVVVDTDIDIFDDRHVEWALATRFQAETDMVVVHGARGSSLDATSKNGVTSKVGIDATMPVGREEEFKKIRK